MKDGAAVKGLRLVWLELSAGTKERRTQPFSSACSGVGAEGQGEVMEFESCQQMSRMESDSLLQYVPNIAWDMFMLN